MVRVLVLAYSGTAVPLLFLAYDTPWIQFINLQFVATEVVRALAGTTGLVLSIPATAFCAAWWAGRERHLWPLPGLPVLRYNEW